LNLLGYIKHFKDLLSIYGRNIKKSPDSLRWRFALFIRYQTHLINRESKVYASWQKIFKALGERKQNQLKYYCQKVLERHLIHPEDILNIFDESTAAS
jgi:hypothetical protein